MYQDNFKLTIDLDHLYHEKFIFYFIRFLYGLFRIQILIQMSPCRAPETGTGLYLRGLLPPDPDLDQNASLKI